MLFKKKRAAHEVWAEPGIKNHRRPNVEKIAGVRSYDRRPANETNKTMYGLRL